MVVPSVSKVNMPVSSVSKVNMPAPPEFEVSKKELKFAYAIGLHISEITESMKNDYKDYNASIDGRLKDGPSTGSIEHMKQGMILKFSKSSEIITSLVTKYGSFEIFGLCKLPSRFVKVPNLFYDLKIRLIKELGLKKLQLENSDESAEYWEIISFKNDKLSEAVYTRERFTIQESRAIIDKIRNLKENGWS